MTPYMVIGNATSMGNDLFQQLSATIKVPAIFDCIKTIIENEALFLVKTCYDGKILQKLTFNNCVPMMFTLTPNAFKSAEHILPNKPKVIKVSIKKYLKKVRARLIDVMDYSSENLDLTEADKIISGGRGIKGENNFKLIEELANLIGASVGASRAAVESGWRPHTYQIGQAGKKVFPKIYIACGISGSTQHIAGMKDSKVIVAINKDPNAPIFKISDYGIVDDCLNVLSAMIKTVKKFQKKENLSKA
jgi:electron transfer flavoprotein alpha subunit